MTPEATTMLALQLLAFLLDKAPQIVAAFRAGAADDLDWDALQPRSIADLEREVDAAQAQVKEDQP